MSLEEYSEGMSNHNDDAQRIVQEIVKALGSSQEVLAKIKEFKVSIVPVVVPRFEITIIPEK
jgi:spore maturation protein CgeB